MKMNIAWALAFERTNTTEDANLSAAEWLYFDTKDSYEDCRHKKDTKKGKKKKMVKRRWDLFFVE